MRREGRIHGYEFERHGGAAPRRRVKASGKPTNRSKIRPLPRDSIRCTSHENHSQTTTTMMMVKGSKALKKTKGQRNKALAADDDDWTLRRLSRSPASAPDVDSSDNDLLDPPRHLHPVSIAEFTGAVLFLDPASSSSSDAEIGCDFYDQNDADDDDDSYDCGDWLDLGIVDTSDTDEWFFC